MSTEIPKVSDEMRELVEEFETASHNFGRSNTTQENGEAVRWEAKRTASRDALLSRIASLEADGRRLDWMQALMTPTKPAPVEIFFAGLRGGERDATEFQCEIAPADGNWKSFSGKSLREAIDSARVSSESKTP